MVEQANTPATNQNLLAVAVSLELASRIFSKISGGVVAGSIEGHELNNQAVSSLIGSKMNSVLLSKIGGV